MKPTNVLPASPRKMCPFQLCTRNPSSDPAKISASPPTNQWAVGRLSSITAASTQAATAAVPAHRPFMLSRKLKAFVSTTSHATVAAAASAAPQSPGKNRLARTPNQITTAAHANCTISRGHHGRPRRSSQRPTASSAVPAPSTASSVGSFATTPPA